jgi:translocation and assembly module TamA
LELQRAIFNNWAVSTFYDAGNAFDDATNLKLYQGAGIGLHYETPIGALNLSLARQISVPDPQFRIHFTIGFQL